MRSADTMTMPSSVTEFSSALAEAALRGQTLDPREVNDRLAITSEESLPEGCLAWRQASNTLRIAHYPEHHEALERIRAGHLIATALHPARTTARRVGKTLYVEGTNLLTTGVGYASLILLEATTAEGPTAILVPAALIISAHRPAFVGLGAADNALIDIVGTVSTTAVLGGMGGAAAVIERPYNVGLTMGAVALGGARSVLRVVQSTILQRSARDERIGHVVADVAAAAALVEMTPFYAPVAGWWSRAAKLAATAAATRACRTAMEILGAATYAESHPLVSLERDLAGLAYQAPTNDGAAAAVAGGLTQFTNRPTTTRRTTC